MMNCRMQAQLVNQGRRGSEHNQSWVCFLFCWSYFLAPSSKSNLYLSEASNLVAPDVLLSQARTVHNIGSCPENCPQFSGGGSSAMACTLWDNLDSPSAENVGPNYSTESLINLHFSLFALRPKSSRHCNNLSSVAMCCSWVLLVTWYHPSITALLKSL